MFALKSIANSDLLTLNKIEMRKVKEYYVWTAKKVWVMMTSDKCVTSSVACEFTLTLDIVGLL